MTKFGTEILGRPVGRYVETDEPPGLTLPQTAAGRLWAPMAVMGIMLVATTRFPATSSLSASTP